MSSMYVRYKPSLMSEYIVAMISNYRIIIWEMLYVTYIIIVDHAGRIGNMLEHENEDKYLSKCIVIWGPVWHHQYHMHYLYSAMSIVHYIFVSSTASENTWMDILCNLTGKPYKNVTVLWCEHIGRIQTKSGPLTMTRSAHKTEGTRNIQTVIKRCEMDIHRTISWGRLTI